MPRNLQVCAVCVVWAPPANLANFAPESDISPHSDELVHMPLIVHCCPPLL
jgi:hypothetical protein